MEALSESVVLDMLGRGVAIDVVMPYVVRLYEAEVFGFLHSLGADDDDANEAAQRAFLEASQVIKRYDRARGGLGTWLCTIAKRKLFRIWRDRKREQAGLERLAQCCPLSAEGPAELALKEARRFAVWRMLSRLKPEEAVIGVMRWMEWLSYEQISIQTGRPVSTVKKIALRVKHQLRMMLIITPLPDTRALEREMAWL